MNSTSNMPPPLPRQDDLVDRLQRSLASISFDILLEEDEDSDNAASDEPAAPYMDYFQAAFDVSSNCESPLKGREIWIQSALNGNTAIHDDISILSVDVSDGEETDDDSSDSSDDESMYFEDEVPLEVEDELELHPYRHQGSSTVPMVSAVPLQSNLPSTSLHFTFTASPPGKGNATFVSMGSSQQLSHQLFAGSNMLGKKSKGYEYEQQILAAWRW